MSSIVDSEIVISNEPKRLEEDEKIYQAYELKGTESTLSSVSSTTEEDESNSYFEEKPSSMNTVFTPSIEEEEEIKHPTDIISEDASYNPSMDQATTNDDDKSMLSIDNTTLAIQSSKANEALSHNTDLLERQQQIPSRLSSISLSDMNDVSLSDELVQNPLQMITSALINGEKPEHVVPKPVPTTNRLFYVEESLEEDGSSVLSSPTRSIFTIFSSFRSSSSTHTSPASSRRPSKQTIGVIPPSIVAARPSSVISPLPGFQEALLAQMEQLNQANTNDPKSTVMKRMKRQSIRQSLVLQNKDDDYDWDFWAGVMCDYQNLNKVNKDLLKYIRIGIPPSIRGMVWQVLAKSKDERLVTKYMELLKLASPYDKLIQRDLARTFPGHHYFKETDGQGQESLYHVVKAYSVYDQKVGYCQGLGFIVGPILLNMPDEDAFCLLVQLMNTYGLRGHFTPDMDGLQLRLYQFDALLEEHLPHVARHLKQQEISSTMYASQWFMTLFAYKFPLHLVYRIYDVIFAEGVQSIFKFAIALLKRNQRTILGLDFEHLLDFLKNGLFEEYKDDDSQFVSDACELEIPSKRLAQLEKEHKIQLQKEITDANIVEELQKSNLELKQQYKILELKTSTLKHEQEEVNHQLRRTVHQIHALEEEGVSLRTFVSTLESTMATLPAKVASQTREKHERLYHENASLIEKNAVLEDRLQRAEMELIHIKMQYAESEIEKEEMHKRLYELKKLMSF